MKPTIIFNEMTLSLLLLFFLVILFDPFHILMLSMTQVFVVCCIVIVFSSYVLFLFREQVRDEREEQHRFLASRFAFFFGASVLVVGITVEKLQHHSVRWFILALAAMVIGKLIGHAYASHRK